MMRFVISCQPSGEFQFHLKDTSGRPILWSPRYSTKKQCLNGIENIRSLAGHHDSYVGQWQTDSGRYIINVKNQEGQLLAMSSPFNSKYEYNRFIDELNLEVKDAVQEDITA
jgi:uncharacterized protein YegP (UPF0339 family)